MPTLLKSGTTDTPSLPVGSPSINAPKIESAKSLRATVTAISSVDQIYGICENVFNPSSDRNIKNGILADVLNDSPPFGRDLAKKGQGYRHNFSTGFLSGIIDPVVSYPVDVIDNAQYLTSAALDEKDDPDGTKTEAYRRKFTKLLRSWDGWRDHIYQIAQEDVPWGYTAVFCDDPDDWRPECERQDNFGVPDNSGQRSSKVQFICRRKSFYINELIEKLVEQPEDSDGPWNMEACVEALNESMPEDRTQQGNAANASNRTFVDLVRDGNAGAAYDPRARTVDVYILYATEADGKVSKFIVTQKNSSQTGQKQRLLYESFNEFEKLSDVVMLYALKPASTLYSSKGLARDLGNVAMATERLRNKAADNMYLGSLVWMHAEEGMVAVQLKVMDTCAVIGSRARVQADALPDKSESFDRGDERMSRYAQQKAGTYIVSKPSQYNVQGGKKTAHEVERDWQKEQQDKAAWLKRFFGQFGDEVSMIARKVGTPDTRDEEAKKFQKDLEESDGITKELLKKLVEQPQGQMIEDMTQKRTQTMVQAMPQVQASPFWDHYGFEREVATRTIGKETVDKYMNKNGIDPNSELKNLRQQMDENGMIRNGDSPPVADDDHHPTHLKWLVTDLDKSEPKIDQKVKSGEILQTPEVLDNHQTAIKHGDAHVEKWERQAQIRNAGEELKQAGQFKGRLAQSQQKQDAWLKASKDRKDRMEKQQAEQAQQQQQILPQLMQGMGATQVRPIDPDVLKSYVNHFDILPNWLKPQVVEASGFQVPPNANDGNGNGEKPLTPASRGVTQTVNP